MKINEKLLRSNLVYLPPIRIPYIIKTTNLKKNYIKFDIITGKPFWMEIW